VADVQPSQIRIGDTERESALSALSEHMTAGRLDIDEYGDRTARVSTAKTRGDLLALFGDLPEPHPTFGTPIPQYVPEPEQAPVLARRNFGMRQRLAASAVPLAALVAVGLYFAVHFWVVFLIPAAVVLLSGAIWGDDWKHQRRLVRERQRQEIREMRRRGRGW
jgi:hypothetical protein